MNVCCRRGRLWGTFVPAAPADFYLYKIFLIKVILLLAFGPSRYMYVELRRPLYVLSQPTPHRRRQNEPVLEAHVA